MIKPTSNFKKYLILLLFIFSLIISLGHVDRWVVSEYVAMAENFLENGTFYPENNQQNVKGVSVYTPGLAYVALLFLNLGFIDFIFEFIICFSVLFLFLFIEIQRKITEDLFKISISRTDSFIYLSLLIILLPRWFDYTLQFKPSIIAQTLGFFILYSFLGLKDNSNIFIYVFLGYLYSIPIIFKQQYVSFIIGFLFFTFFNRNIKNIVFSLSSISGLLSFYFHPELDQIQYWNYEIFSDDGFTSPLLILSEHYLVILRLFFLVGFVYVLGLRFNNIVKFSPKYVLKIIVSNPIYSIILPSFFAIYLGLFKAGGNDGNIDGALILLTPLFFNIFRLIDFKYIVLFSTIGIFSLLPKVYLSAEEYIEIRQLKNYISQMNIQKDLKLVTDSHVYFASRMVEDKSKLDNFHTYSLQIPGRGSPNLDAYIRNKVQKKPYLLLVENIHTNKLFIEKNNLNLIYENGAGLIASTQTDQS